VRLSTPNLDWVWQTHYNAQAFAEAKQEMAIVLNRAFRGWEHQFLWNREFLGEVLESCGFVDVTWCRYRESEHEVFRGIERHPTSEDTDDQPHVLIVEARKGEEQPERLEALRWRIETGFLQHMSAVCRRCGLGAWAPVDVSDSRCYGWRSGPCEGSTV
jgi:hypothetical protein